MKFFLFLLIASTSLWSQNDYKKQIKNHRQALNNTYKSDHSPLSSTDKKLFKGLPFFNIDEKYKIKAKLEYAFNSPVVYFETNGSQTQAYQKYATASFTIDEKKLQLNIYQNLNLKKRKGYENYLFIPFTDTSNNKTTYGAGRYIDTRIPKEYTGYITLDFNKAYNPYCAYSNDFSCPIPPKENHLDIDILAGVKYTKKY